MNSGIHQNLEQAIQYLNRKDQDEKRTRVWIETLTQDLLNLDSRERTPDRRELCRALENVLQRLENKESVIFLQEPIRVREDYLPSGGDSLRAVHGAFVI
jgi:hypothetical protein